MLVTWNQPWWEYLHHGNWQTLQSRPFYSPLKSLYQNTTERLEEGRKRRGEGRWRGSICVQTVLQVGQPSLISMLHLFFSLPETPLLSFARITKICPKLSSCITFFPFFFLNDFYFFHYSWSFRSFFFFLLVFLGPHPQQFPQLGVKWKPQHQPMPQPEQHRIRTTSATYSIAHSNTGSFTHWARPGMELMSSWILVWFATTEPQQESQASPLLEKPSLMSGLHLCEMPSSSQCTPTAW